MIVHVFFLDFLGFSPLDSKPFRFSLRAIPEDMLRLLGHEAVSRGPRLAEWLWMALAGWFLTLLDGLAGLDGFRFSLDDSFVFHGLVC